MNMNNSTVIYIFLSPNWVLIFFPTSVLLFGTDIVNQAGTVLSKHTVEFDL